MKKIGRFLFWIIVLNFACIAISFGAFYAYLMFTGQVMWR